MGRFDGKFVRGERTQKKSTRSGIFPGAGPFRPPLVVMAYVQVGTYSLPSRFLNLYIPYVRHTVRLLTYVLPGMLSVSTYKRTQMPRPCITEDVRAPLKAVRAVWNVRSYSST